MSQPHAKFLKPFLKNNDFKIIGNAGFRKLSNGRRAKVTLDYSNHIGQFSRLVVQIICIKGGEIDRHGFKFSDTMDMDPTNTHRNANQQGDTLYIWGKMKWYINTPTKSSVKVYLQEIEDYIEMFE